MVAAESSPRDSKLPCSLNTHACIIDPADAEPCVQFLKTPQEPLEGACRGHSPLELFRAEQNSAGGDEMPVSKPCQQELAKGRGRGPALAPSATKGEAWALSSHIASAQTAQLSYAAVA